MSVRKLQNFVNGEYVEAKSGETSDVINPATGQVYATAPVSSAADVDAASRQPAFLTAGPASDRSSVAASRTSTGTAL